MNSELNTILKSLPLKTPTCDTWPQIALANLDVFLTNHASCERKAHAGAMMLANKHPQLPELQDRMYDLAEEELIHLKQVLKILRGRNLSLPPDCVDIYVNQLLQQVRNPQNEHLLDRLVAAAVIEARSAERFCLIAEHLPPGDLKTYYLKFAKEESRHYPFFIETAALYFSRSDIHESLDRFLAADATLIKELPVTPTVH